LVILALPLALRGISLELLLASFSLGLLEVTEIQTISEHPESRVSLCRYMGQTTA